MRPFKGAERGATAVTIAITMLVLMGFTALALDGGAVYNERRSTHNAADHAALSAAWAACNDEDPEAAGLAAAVRNGYDTDEDAIDVQINHLGGNQYQAIVTSVEDTTFARLIGSDEVTVLSDAIADCDFFNNLGGFALFAGGSQDRCGNSLDTPGSSLEVNGGAHSNGSIHSPGPPDSKSYDEPVSYGPDGGVSGPDDQWPGPPNEPFETDEWLDGDDPIYPVPDYWVIENYDDDNTNDTVDDTPAEQAADAGEYFTHPGGTTIPGGSLDPGLHYVDGNIQLSGDSYFLNDVTIVATGQIHISGSFITGATPYFDDGLLFFSSHPGSTSCNTPAILYSNASGNWSGVWFAPNGQIRINSSSGFTADGSLIGYTINLAGADRTITYNETFGDGPWFTVELTK